MHEKKSDDEEVTENAKCEKGSTGPKRGGFGLIAPESRITCRATLVSKKKDPYFEETRTRIDSATNISQLFCATAELDEHRLVRNGKGGNFREEMNKEHTENQSGFEVLDKFELLEKIVDELESSGSSIENNLRNVDENFDLWMV